MISGEDSVTRAFMICSYSSSNISQLIKSRRIDGAGSSTYEGRIKVHTGLRWENLKKRDHLEESGIDRRIILKFIFMKLNRGHGLDLPGSG